MFISGESGHAISDVAGRENAIFVPQAPRATAIIGDSDHRGEISNRTARTALFGVPYIFLEAAKNRREAGAAAERDNTDRTGTVLRRFFHGKKRKLYPAEPSRSG
jgi:hypothetical protein